MTLLLGCSGVKWPQREGFVNPEGVYIIHSPGIMGALGNDKQMARGLIRAGVQEVRLHEWTSPNTLKNLTNTKLHEREAKKLVAEIIKLHEDHPEARIVLTAHSGGTYIAVRAVEMLGDSESSPLVEQLWLFAPSISPDYDFTEALAHVQTINVVVSEHDWLILGLGTRLLGTSDRVNSVSAGKIGFSMQHPRLIIWRYNSEWRKLGNGGDHLASLAEPFIIFVVAPAILEPDLNHFYKVTESRTGDP